MTQRDFQKKDFIWCLKEEFTMAKKTWQKVVRTERSHLHPHVWSWCGGRRCRQTEIQTTDRDRQTERQISESWGQDIRLLKPAPHTCSPSDTFSRKSVPPKSSIISPNSAPNWGPNIQIFEPYRRYIFIQTLHKSQYVFLFNLKRVSILHYEYLASDIIFDMFTRCLNFVSHHFGGTWISVDGTWVWAPWAGYPTCCDVSWPGSPESPSQL